MVKKGFDWKWGLLFLMAAGLLIVDLALPDPLPIIDEVILAITVYLTGSKALGGK
jgi:hypothetical protein